MEQQLSKLRIQAYSDGDFLKPWGEPFVVQINPEELTRQYAIQYRQVSTPGSTREGNQFYRVPPESMNIKFTLDGTGVVPEDGNPLRRLGQTAAVMARVSDTSYVTRRLKEFKANVYDYSGDIHRTPFIKLIWGDTEGFMKGVMSNLRVRMVLFAPDGSPLRAEVDFQIQSYQSDQECCARRKDSSPDLTHARTVKEGDNIMILTDEIYGDPSYYLEVARVNGLTNFRALETGSEMIFPPLEKAGK
ncbi:MAG: hypothetical protein KDD01_04845 [Phaeodactylibacter sp.]|nr:hypothetical protein [Phaeodactylibacter sp.]MCB0612470.1 hypothetical protein [Phaeodactylibacter sp.]MCB9304590.1 hypothetical protein [Lewinellaceae bacterium]